MEDVEPGTAAKRQASGGAYYYETAEAEERAWVPWLVPGFMLACVGVFVVEMYVNNCPAHSHPSAPASPASSIASPSSQPGRIPSLGPPPPPYVFLPSVMFISSLLVWKIELLLYACSLSLTLLFFISLEKMGALEWNRVVHQNQGWRLLSCVWLHAGLIHLIVNMLSLIFVGIRLEQQFGFVRIGTIYILSGFGGAVLSALLLRNNISVGASGALFGLLGSMLSELFINWTIYSNRIAALLTLMVIIIINLVIGLFPSVDNFAHIGGFLSGFLLGFVLLIRSQFGWMERRDLPPSAQVTSKYKAYQCVLWLLALILLVAGFAVCLIMLFKGVNGNDHCHWCHYLNCVPTSSWNCEN